jgi:DNA-binding NarL/FixJ family response regulator
MAKASPATVAAAADASPKPSPASPAVMTCAPSTRPRRGSRLIEEFTASPAARPGLRKLAGRLTARETDVLTLAARGLSNAEIARELFLGETTVKTHIGHVLEKLQLRDRVQAVIFAYEAGLIRPGTGLPP